MRAAVLPAAGQPLIVVDDYPVPKVGRHDLLVRVEACGVCRTDLHVVDGDLRDASYPLVPGHEVVGVVVDMGSAITSRRLGERVGIPWLAWTCGECDYCRTGQENLCGEARFTGYTVDGGFAEHVRADERYCFPLPPRYSAVQAAPLLCAGLIGYRAWKKVKSARHLGLYGFGAAAHIAIQIARHAGQTVYAFTRPGDVENQAFAREMGAHWAADSTELPPRALDAAIIFAPVGALVPAALRASGRGATIVCAGIHMSDIPTFPYALLWGERTIQSVANLTREDAREFLALAPSIPVETTTAVYRIGDAPQAVADLRLGRINGAAVIVP